MSSVFNTHAVSHPSHVCFFTYLLCPFIAKNPNATPKGRFDSERSVLSITMRFPPLFSTTGVLQRKVDFKLTDLGLHPPASYSPHLLINPQGKHVFQFINPVCCRCETMLERCHRYYSLSVEVIPRFRKVDFLNIATFSRPFNIFPQLHMWKFFFGGVCNPRSVKNPIFIAHL